jgi:hypothetical protein
MIILRGMGLNIKDLNGQLKYKPEPLNQYVTKKKVI